MFWRGRDCLKRDLVATRRGMPHPGVSQHRAGRTQRRARACWAREAERAQLQNMQKPINF